MWLTLAASQGAANATRYLQALAPQMTADKRADRLTSRRTGSPNGSRGRRRQRLRLPRDDRRAPPAHVRGRGSIAAARTENIGRTALELRFPGRDLIGVHVELLGQLR